MMIAEQRINNCSLFRMMVVCSSIMVFFSLNCRSVIGIEYTFLSTDIAPMCSTSVYFVDLSGGN